MKIVEPPPPPDDGSIGDSKHQCELLGCSWCRFFFFLADVRLWFSYGVCVCHACLFACVFVCLRVCLLACLFACVFVCLRVCLFVISLGYSSALQGQSDWMEPVP